MVVSEINPQSRIIAKNTLMLYFRMIIVMIVSLLSSRIVLATLGVEDYGIYNVVGGVVAMFSIVTTSLIQAIGRFLTFQLGKHDENKLKDVFATSIIVQVLMVIVVILLSEIIGVWLLNNYLVIPNERLPQAHWVLQLSIIAFCINLLGIPYRALIIAHEKMVAFAYFSIVEAALELLIIVILLYGDTDKLILYAFLKVLVALIIRFLYVFYCKKHFSECQHRIVIRRDILREMGEFAGWTFIGTSSSILRDQGVNILLNLFFGPVVNAARGISSQVNTAVSSFSSNMMMAVRPQIIKSYAQGNNNYMFFLVNMSARASFYLLLILSLPVIINANFLLGIWLVEVPEHAVWFVRLFLILSLMESLSIPLVSAATATGKIKNWQIIVGGLKMLDFPLCYLALLLGGLPEIVLIVSIIMSQVCLLVRLFLLQKMTGFSAVNYLKGVYFNAMSVAMASFVISFVIYNMMEKSLLSSILCVIVCALSSFLSIFYIGCDHMERERIMIKVKVWIRN